MVRANTERGHRVSGFQKLAPTTRRMGSDHVSAPRSGAPPPTSLPHPQATAKIGWQTRKALISDACVYEPNYLHMGSPIKHNAV